MEHFTLPHHHGESAQVEHLRRELVKIQQFDTVAEIFRQLGDPTRVRIFWLLSHQEECVVNISAMLQMSSPAVSHHLRSLHDCGLIVSRRCGKEVYYRAADTEKCRLLHKIIEQIMEIACPETAANLHGAPEDVIHHVHEYLMENLAQRITIEELSRQFLMNPTTLKSTFKKVYGTSLAAHMKEHRMTEAARLLLTTSQSVAQIACAVGYDSQSRFTAAFKGSYGVLPTEYRKHLQENETKKEL